MLRQIFFPTSNLPFGLKDSRQDWAGVRKAQRSGGQADGKEICYCSLLSAG